VVRTARYWRQKGDVRINIAVARVTEQGLPTVYVTKSAGTRTGVRRRVVRPGIPTVRWHSSSPASGTVVTTQWVRRDTTWRCENGTRSQASKPITRLFGCVLGLRDYVNKMIPGVVPLGLSGGSTPRCARPWRWMHCGPERVRLRDAALQIHSRQESLDEAAACAKALGVRYEMLPIAPASRA